jgi:DNA polymerase III gamma/tau subunit
VSNVVLASGGKRKLQEVIEDARRIAEGWITPDKLKDMIGAIKESGY